MTRGEIANNLLQRADMIEKQVILYKDGYIGLKSLYESINYQASMMLCKIEAVEGVCCVEDEEEIG